MIQDQGRLLELISISKDRTGDLGPFIFIHIIEMNPLKITKDNTDVGKVIFIVSIIFQYNQIS